MSKAREILEERFARGEISSDEFDNMVRKVELGEKETRSSTIKAESESNGGPYGSWLLGFAGVASGVIILNFTEKILNSIVNDCVAGGRSVQFCNDNGINWPLVYATGYAPAIFALLCGIGLMLLPKKKKTSNFG